MSTTMTPTPPNTQTAAAYKPPRHPGSIDLRLDANEGAPPDPSLLEAVRADFGEICRRYPDAKPLEERLARLTGVAPDRVLATAGADDALERAVRLTASRGRRGILTRPTFEMLPRYVDRAGLDLCEIAWLDGAFPTDAILRAIDANTAMVAVVTPNNPTGAVATAADLRAIRKRLEEVAPDAILLVDLAYTEFADEDLTPTALSLPNAIITRTMSKAWGLAGLRVGWAAGSSPLIDSLRAIGQPFAISGPSIALACARLDRSLEPDADVIERMRTERAVLLDTLRSLRAEPIASQANFVLARFANAPWVADALAGLGIAVRRFTDRPGLADFLRIGCPASVEGLARVQRALETALRPALIVSTLFDTMSGVPVVRTLPADRAAGVWMVVDSLEGVAAARRFGAVPIVLAETADDDDPFRRAGAARVIRSPSQLPELLP